MSEELTPTNEEFDIAYLNNVVIQRVEHNHYRFVPTEYSSIRGFFDKLHKDWVRTPEELIYFQGVNDVPGDGTFIRQLGEWVQFIPIYAVDGNTPNDIGDTVTRVAYTRSAYDALLERDPKICYYITDEGTIIWDNIEYGSLVKSVNGKTGDIILVASDITTNDADVQSDLNSKVSTVDGNDKILKIDDTTRNISAEVSASYDSSSGILILKGRDDVVLSTINLPLEQFLENVMYDPDTNIITFEWNTVAGIEDMEVNLTGLIDTYEGSDSIDVSNGVVSVKIDGNETHLKSNENGLYLDLSDIGGGNKSEVTYWVTDDASAAQWAGATPGNDYTVVGIAKADKSVNLNIQIYSDVNLTQTKTTKIIGDGDTVLLLTGSIKSTDSFRDVYIENINIEKHASTQIGYGLLGLRGTFIHCSLTNCGIKEFQPSTFIGCSVLIDFENTSSSEISIAGFDNCINCIFINCTTRVSCWGDGIATSFGFKNMSGSTFIGCIADVFSLGGASAYGFYDLNTCSLERCSGSGYGSGESSKGVGFYNIRYGKMTLCYGRGDNVDAANGICFYLCGGMTYCRPIGPSGSVKYTSCYVDHGSTQTVANTSDGGWNQFT